MASALTRAPNGNGISTRHLGCIWPHTQNVFINKFEKIKVIYKYYLKNKNEYEGFLSWVL